MTPSREFRIDAVVDAVERPALVAAGEQLAECLSAADAAAWTVTVRFRESFAAVAAAEPPHAIVASLLPELARECEPVAVTTLRWRAALAAVLRDGIAPVFICTIFRCVGEQTPRPRPGDAPSTLERIRRLNLMAVLLSHETGAGVADIDRVFAHVGVPERAIDYRLAGPAAAEVAGYAVVSAILASGQDDVIAPQIQAGAQRFQGTPSELVRLVRRRLARASR